MFRNSAKIYQKAARLRALFAMFLVVLISMGLVFVFQNPKKTAAVAFCDSHGQNNECVITSNYTLLAMSDGDDYSNQDVVLGDGINSYIVTINTPHVFKSLTIKNNVILTHDALTVSDFTDHDTLKLESDPNNPSAISSKWINIDVIGTLNIENGGSINADGKGSPGGDATTSDFAGYGYKSLNNHTGGLDQSGGITSNRGGGGGNGGKGGKSAADDVSLETKTVDEETHMFGQNNPNVLIPQYGAGGGGAKLGSETGNGGAGGGIIIIQAGTIQLNSGGKISANGATPPECTGLPDCSGAVGGAGAGGYIQIVAKTSFLLPDDGLPTANGGSDSYIPQTDSKGQDGIVQLNPPAKKFGLNITANGGNGKTQTLNVLSASGGGGIINIDSPVTSLICTAFNNGEGISENCEGGAVVIDGVEVFADKVIINQNTGSKCLDTDLTNPAIPCDTKRHFHSLTIRNGGKLTHSKILVTDMGAMSSLLGSSSTARWKKVDLDISTSLTIESNGKIDVSAAGYPGGISGHGIGYGPGGGDFNNDNGKGGGGYGGHGGQGGHASGFDYGGGGVSYGSAIDPNEWGSGGGLLGGAGGGLINIKASTIILKTLNAIMARGEAALSPGEKGGGGSGGTVHLTTDIFSIDSGIESTVIDASGNNGGDNGQGSGSESGGNGGGGRIAIHAPTLQGVNYDSLMYPSAGNPKYLLVESGVPGVPRPGEGRISITYEQAQQLCVTTPSACAWIVNYGERGTIYLAQNIKTKNIAKRLSPIERPMGTPNTSFNPYAVKDGDIIMVTITAPGLNNGSLVADDWLKVINGNKACAPIFNNSRYPILPSADSPDGENPITWTYNGSTSSFSYYCQVKDKE